jgi:hypothetical protein
VITAKKDTHLCGEFESHLPNSLAHLTTGRLLKTLGKQNDEKRSPVTVTVKCTGSSDAAERDAFVFRSLIKRIEGGRNPAHNKIINKKEIKGE